MTAGEAADFFSGLSTPIIASIVALIAFQQWKTNRLALREKLFDRRFQIFKETQAYLSEILRDARRSDESMWRFTDTCQRARFVFGKEMQSYLLEIRTRSNKMAMHQAVYKDMPVGEERSKRVDAEHECLEWLTNQLDVIFDKFEPFMDLSKEA